MSGLYEYKRKLAIAERQPITTRGTTVFLRKATGEIKVTTRTMQILEGMGEHYTVTMAPSEKLFTAAEFDSVTIENIAGVENTVELYIGYGDFFRPVPDLVLVQVENTNPIDVNVTASGAPSSAIDSFADVSGFGQGQANKVSALPINLSRVRAILTSPASNTDTLRIGDTGVDVANGIPLAPGESVPLDTTAEIFVCSQGATAGQTLAVTELNL